MNLPNQRSDLFNSDLLESSNYDEYEREEYGKYNNSQGKQNSLKGFDSKERLKNDLMPTIKYEQSKINLKLFIISLLGRKEPSSYGGNRTNNLNPYNEYKNNYSNASNDYNINLNRYDKK